MLIKHTGEIVREAQLEDSLAKSGSRDEPQAWHFKTYNDAANYGVELVWPYEDLTIDPQNGPDFEYYTKLSEHFFGIIFPGYIQVPENHNLFIFQHHTHSVAWNMPRPISQMIEYDWWPLSPQVIFEIPSEPSAFIQNKPFAQAIAIPRRTYTVKEMTKEESDVLGTYTEAVDAAYSNVTLTGVSWTVGTAAGVTTGTFAQQEFSFSSSASVFGYFVTDNAGANLLWAERFDSAPFSLPSGGGTIAVDPAIELE